MPAATLLRAAAGRPRTASTPAAMSGLVHDWDPDSIAQADNTAVSSWADSVGGGVAQVQATGAKQPKVRTGANGLNGHNVVRYDGTDDFTKATYGATLAQSTTVLVVAKVAVIDGTQRIVFDGIDATNRQVLQVNTSGAFQGFAGTNQTLATADTGWHLFSIVFAGARSIGRVEGLAAGLSVGFGTNGAAGMVLGSRFTGATGFSSCDIARVLVFNRALTSAELVAMQNYLAARFGLSVAVPSSTVYVSTVSGVDDIVASEDAPAATVAHAFQFIPPGGGEVLIEADEAHPLREQVYYTGAASVRLDSVDRSSYWHVYGSEKHTSGWTSAGGGVWTKVLAGHIAAADGVDSVVVTDMTDADGDFLVLRPARVVAGATVTAPAAGQSGWNFATSTMYVHLADGSDPNGHTIEISKRLFGIASIGLGKLSVHHARARFAASTCIQAGDSFDGEVEVFDSKAEYAGSQSCLRAVNSTTASKLYAERTEAALCTANDGWSVKGASLVECHDCEGRKTWEEITTSHDTATLKFYGGRLHHAYGAAYEGVLSSLAIFDGVEVDHNNVGLGDTTQCGPSGSYAITYRDTMTGSVTNCDVHDNHLGGVGLQDTVGAGVTVDAYTLAHSGVANGNGAADDLANVHPFYN